MARDLVSKLLKTNPAERIKLDEVTNHAWFKVNPPLKPVTELAASSPKLNLTEEIKKENYQVVSKPSVVNKAEV